MFGQKTLSAALLGVVLPLVGLGCQTTEVVPPARLVNHTVPSSVQVPRDVERLVVLYRRTPHRDEEEAYRRLEGAAFQLKELRPSLQIIDRSDMDTLLHEQRFQMSGRVSEDTAVRVGRLLGVDSVLIYGIQGPTFRDRMFAEAYWDIPPFLVTSKIIRVESGEILFHNVVTAPIHKPGEPTRAHFSSGLSASPVMRDALDRGVAQTITDLQHAFR